MYPLNETLSKHDVRTAAELHIVGSGFGNPHLNKLFPVD
jgi:hypothetical protein